MPPSVIWQVQAGLLRSYIQRVCFGSSFRERAAHFSVLACICAGYIYVFCAKHFYCNANYTWDNATTCASHFRDTKTYCDKIGLFINVTA